MVPKWYYLSEMCVSSKHGGGLTLQRILQEDLKQFDNFFHLSEFATKEYPIIEELKARQVNLHQLYPDNGIWSKQIIHFRDRVINKLKLQRYFEMGWEKWDRKHIRYPAEYLLHNSDVTHSSWLVVPQSILSIRVLNRVLRHTPIDYITWMMDDHVIQWNNEKGWYYPEGFEEEFAFHLQNARKVLVISPTMARFYKTRFGIDSEVLFGPADPIGTPVYQSPEPSGPVRLCYFGAIWNWQRDALEVLVRHLPSLDATLEIFTFHDLPASLQGGNVRVRPPVPPQEVVPRMREYDGVVIPASFEEGNRGNTELNISTKMSECLASGTVTVVIGPEYAAMVQFARQNGGALVVSDVRDAAQLARIRSLKESRFRERLLSEARNTAETICSVEVMRTVWKKCWDREKE